MAPLSVCMCVCGVDGVDAFVCSVSCQPIWRFVNRATHQQTAFIANYHHQHNRESTVWRTEPWVSMRCSCFVNVYVTASVECMRLQLFSLLLFVQCILYHSYTDKQIKYSSTTSVKLYSLAWDTQLVCVFSKSPISTTLANRVESFKFICPYFVWDIVWSQGYFFSTRAKRPESRRVSALVSLNKQRE